MSLDGRDIINTMNIKENELQNDETNTFKNNMTDKQVFWTCLSGDVDLRLVRYGYVLMHLCMIKHI
jgi:hypothetical protein